MFPLKFDSQIVQVSKIQEPDFTPAHHETISRIRYERQTLVIPDARWSCQFLGAGEEKAVFCICDQSNRVFALELIDERHYLNGRFVGGVYFFSKRVQSLAGVRANTDSDFGLTFTGLVKAREFVYGYEWVRFQFDPRRKTWLDSLLTAFLQAAYGTRFGQYQARYKDVHGRNVLFEISAFNRSGVPIILRDWSGKLKLAKVGLQPVDVR